eukprot:365041-Chlamydomonas_euryale.AAC.3
MRADGITLVPKYDKAVPARTHQPRATACVSRGTPARGGAHWRAGRAAKARLRSARAARRGHAAGKQPRKEGNSLGTRRAGGHAERAAAQACGGQAAMLAAQTCAHGGTARMAVEHAQQHSAHGGTARMAAQHAWRHSAHGGTARMAAQRAWRYSAHGSI